jgi:hypothetical protein
LRHENRQALDGTTWDGQEHTVADVGYQGDAVTRVRGQIILVACHPPTSVSVVRSQTIAAELWG